MHAKGQKIVVLKNIILIVFRKESNSYDIYVRTSTLPLIRTKRNCKTSDVLSEPWNFVTLLNILLVIQLER